MNTINKGLVVIGIGIMKFIADIIIQDGEMLNQITEGKGDLYISMHYDSVSIVYDDELNMRTVDEITEQISTKDDQISDMFLFGGNHTFTDYARNVIADKVKLYNEDLDQYIRDSINCEDESLRKICIQIIDGPKTFSQICMENIEIINTEKFMSELINKFSDVSICD